MNKGSKMPMAWHERNLENAEKYHDKRLADLKAALEKEEKDSESVRFYREQIEAAKAKGMDGFDRERFMKKEKEARGLKP